MPASAAEFDALFAEVSNWGRWGADDASGTLNLADARAACRAATLVRTGQVVSCCRPLGAGIRNPKMSIDNLLHFMVQAGSDVPSTGQGTAADWIGVGLHGRSFTHLDGFSHTFWNGKMYNGLDRSLVTGAGGAAAGGIEPMFNGIVTRGLLVDVPKLLGVDVLPQGTVLDPEHLGTWFERIGTVPEAGDVLYIRFGFGRPNLPTNGGDVVGGLSPRCMPLLRDAGIAVLACDRDCDIYPSGFEGIFAPIHTLALVAMGLWLVDNAELNALAEACEHEGRHEFLTSLAPIPFRRTTGTLLNPVAVF